MMMLAGIVVNNGIILVDHINGLVPAIYTAFERIKRGISTHN